MYAHISGTQLGRKIMPWCTLESMHHGKMAAESFVKKFPCDHVKELHTEIAQKCEMICSVPDKQKHKNNVL
jgi:hypothetical protein